jgi:hypothetical protein
MWPGRERFFHADMKRFFYSHPNVIITAFAVLFAAVIVYSCLWATNDIYKQIHAALIASPQEPSNSFDLTDASKLDLRGISTSTVSTSEGASANSAPEAPAVSPAAQATSTVPITASGTAQ